MELIYHGKIKGKKLVNTAEISLSSYYIYAKDYIIIEAVTSDISVAAYAIYLLHINSKTKMTHGMYVKNKSESRRSEFQITTSSTCFYSCVNPYRLKG